MAITAIACGSCAATITHTHTNMNTADINITTILLTH